MSRSRSEHRRLLRSALRSLGSTEQLEAAEAVAGLLGGWLKELAPGTAAAYAATDGELSPHPTVAWLRRHGWTIAYPSLSGDVMTFAIVHSDDELAPAEFGLMEPPPGAPAVATAALDVVLTPLVGFDSAKSRLGRGKGFYDHAFAFLNDCARPSKPFLIGLAHDVQLVDRLPTEPHDVSMEAIVTPTKIHGHLPT